MHCSSGRRTSLLAIVLYLLIKVMVFTPQSLILAPYGFQLVAERLVLHCRFATLFCALFKVTDVLGSYT